MAAPTVLSRQASVSSTTDSTSFIPTLPTVTVGKLLLAVVTVDGFPAVEAESDGWRETDYAVNGTSVRQTLFIKERSEGAGNDTLVITTDTAQQFSAIVYCIDAGDFPGIVFSFSDGSGTNSNPPECVNILGSRDCLLIATRGGDSTVVPTAAPSGYSNLLNQAGGGTNGVSTSVAERTATVGSENPGAFTVANEQWVCFTIMVWTDTGTRWASYDKGTGIYLDDENRTAGLIAGNFEQGVRATIGKKSGKWGYKIDFGETTWARMGFGDKWKDLFATANPGGMVAIFYDDQIAGTSGFGYGNDTEWNEANGFPLPEEGDECVLLIDLDTGQFWLSHNNGDWNFNPSANPDAGTGGGALQAFFAGITLYPIFYGDDVSEVTATFDSSALVGYANCSTFNYWDYVPAGGYTLTAGSGVFAISANAALLTCARKVVGGAGAFTFTAFDAALRLGKRLLANVGSFSVSAIAAALIVARRIPAGLGPVVVTGNAAGFLATRHIAAVAGTFVVTGFDAILSAATLGYRLVADIGSFAITGIAANLRAGRKISAMHGTIAIAEFAAVLIAARRLAAAAGSLTVTGIDAALTAARKLAASGGSFVVTALDATLQRGKILVAEAGAVLVAAMTASLYRAAVLRGEKGDLAVAGQEASLDYDHPVRWNPVPPNSEAWTEQAQGGTTWENQSPGASPWSEV